MKKIILSFVIAFAITEIASAQESSREIGTETKSGTNILPAAGDISIGVDANPFLRYIGNIFTERNNRSPRFNAQEGALTAKYFLTDKSAFRARLNFDFRTNKEYETVDKIDGQPDEKVDNITSYNNNYFQLALGYEIRRGYGRLQGYYGGEISMGGGSFNKKNAYGNPVTTNYRVERTLEENYGKMFTFGVGGFAGVEYFVAPKLSIGSELGLHFTTFKVKDQKEIKEFWDVPNAMVDTKTEHKGDIREISFKTNTSGSIHLTYHF